MRRFRLLARGLAGSSRPALDPFTIASPRGARRRQPRLERLEPRCLLAITTGFVDPNPSTLGPLSVAMLSSDPYFSGNYGEQTVTIDNDEYTLPSNGDSFSTGGEYGGSTDFVNTYEYLYSPRMAIDPHYNSYVVGYALGTNIAQITYQSETNNYNPQNLSTQSDYMVELIRFDTSGLPQGIKLFQSNVSDPSIVTDNQGDVYLTANAENTTLTASDGPGFTNAQQLYNQPGTGSFVVKMNENGSDANGNVDWATPLPASNPNIATDDAGNVFVSGVITSAVTLGGTSFNPPAGDADVYVAKLNAADGSIAWASLVAQGPSVSGADPVGFHGVAVDSLDNVYVAGQFHNQVNFGPASAPVSVTAPSTSSDIFVTSMNASGTFNWVKSFGGTGVDSVAGIAAKNQSGVFIAGTYQNTLTLGTFNLKSAAPAGTNDLFLAQLNSSGAVTNALNSGGPSTYAYQATSLAYGGTGTIALGASYSYVGSAQNPYSPAPTFNGTALPGANSEDLVATLKFPIPTASLSALPAHTTASPFTVQWSGLSTAGIASYDVYVSVDGGPLTPWLTGTTATSASYSGTSGHSYGFAVVATDTTGLRSPTPASASVSTQLNIPLAATSTTLQASPAQPTFGQPVTLTATVTSTASGTPSGSVTFTINGTGQTPAMLQVMGGNDVATFLAAALGAGSYTISASYGGDGSFAMSTVSQPLTLTVSPATPGVNVTAAGGTYTGAPFAASATAAGVSGGPADTNALSFSYSGATDAGSAYGPTASAPTEAGTYSVTASVAAGGDYAAATSTPTPFTIAQATPVIVAADNGSTIPATATVMVTVPSGAAPDNNPVTFSYTGTTFTDAAYGPTATPPSANGDYSVTATVAAGGDYATATSMPVAFTIGKAAPAITVADPSGPYNGAPYPAMATVTPIAGAGPDDNAVTYNFSGTTGAGVIYGPTATPPTEAGTYSLSATIAAGGNYGAATSPPITLVISPVAPSLTVSYEGSVGVAMAQGVSGGAPDDNALSYSYAGTTINGAAYGPTATPPAGAGNYTVVATVAAGGDYTQVSSSPLAFTIAALEPTLSVADGGGTYSGAPFPATVTVNPAGGGPADNNAVTTLYSGTLASGAGYGPTGAAPTEAGGYTVTASVAAGGSYGAATAAPVPFTISPATPGITLAAASGPAQVTPTVAGVTGGAADTNAISYTYTGTTSAGAAYGPTATPPTVPGNYSVTATVAAGGDYGTATSFPFAFSVTRSTPGITVIDKGGTYSGGGFPASVSLTGTSGSASPSLDGVTPTLTYYAGSAASGTPLPGAPSAAGTYFVQAVFAGSTDYNTASTGTSFVIAPAQAVLRLTPVSGVYNGTPFPVFATIAGVSGDASSSLENVPLTLNYFAGPSAVGNALPGAPSAAGTYTVLASFAGSPDYQPAQTSAPFTIARATPVLVWPLPTPITAGTPLSGAQLDATADVPGSFNYTPGPGITLPSGPGQVLNATFTPSDHADYTTATISTTISVQPAPPPQMMSIVPTGSKKGTTMLLVNFSEPLDMSSATSTGQYQVAGGVTKVVKKHKMTVFSKSLAIKSVTLSGSGTSVTITLAKPYKGAVQVTTLPGLRGANGASSTSAGSLSVA